MTDENPKEKLISNILSNEWYPDEKDLESYLTYSKDHQVLDAIAQRWTSRLMRRHVLSTEGKVSRLRVDRIDDQLIVMYAYSDNLGYIVTSTPVAPICLFKGTAWNDLKKHDQLQTPELPDDPSIE